MELNGARVNHEPKTAIPSGAGHSGGDSQRDADDADEAADAAGAARSTFLRWIRIGEDVVDEEQGGHFDVDSPDPCAALFARVTRACAAARGAVVSETFRTWTDSITGETRSERRVRRRPGDWRASAWLLVRPEPNGWHTLLNLAGPFHDHPDIPEELRETPARREAAEGPGHG